MSKNIVGEESKSDRGLANRILIIEDDPRHRKDAEYFFRTQPDLEVVCASNYRDAAKEMFGRGNEYGMPIFTGDFNGVISDIFFPLSTEVPYNQPEPLGVRVAVELSENGIPFVLITDGFHHGSRYQWITEMIDARYLDKGWSLRSSGTDHDKEGHSKKWDCSYQDLLHKIHKLTEK
jgi:hypothetical protein